MISFTGVQKRFGDTTALEGATFDVQRGELFGLIGPDGAGKSTAMRILVTLLLADEGQVSFDGRDVVEDYRYVRENVGYMPGDFSLYTDLTVEENLRFFARVFSTSIKENYDLIAPIYEQLEPFKDRRAGALSGGMKQKLALCCALIHRPLVLVLDEPTTGVDAVSRKEFWDMLGILGKQDITIMVSTPYLEEASLCDRVGLINDGAMMQIGTTQEVVGSFDKTLLSVEGANHTQALNTLREFHGAISVYPYKDSVRITLEKSDTNDNEESLRHFLNENNIQHSRVLVAQPDIEDRFMDLMISARGDVNV